jgi:hypothetical protein
LPRFSAAFRTEAQARVEAEKIRQQGFWGAVEKHVEWKEDYQNDSSWMPDWERAGKRAVQLVEYF